MSVCRAISSTNRTGENRLPGSEGAEAVRFRGSNQANVKRSQTQGVTNANLTSVAVRVRPFSGARISSPRTARESAIRRDRKCPFLGTLDPIGVDLLIQIACTGWCGGGFGEV